MNENSNIVDITRQALRRIRGAVASGSINAEEMQTLTEQVNDKFAKALLEVSNREHLLKNEDKNPELSHVESLNNFVKGLLKDVDPISHHARPLYGDVIDLMLDIAELRQDYVEDNERIEIIALLSTGALLIAILAYLTNIKVSYAAVGDSTNEVYLPNLNSNPDKERIIVDDVVGNQANAVAKKSSSPV